MRNAIRHRSSRALAVLAVMIAAGPAASQGAPPPLAEIYRVDVAPVFAGNRTILEQPIAYPAGVPGISVAIVTIPPGGETGWHTHAVPLFGYVLEGVLTVDYGTRGIVRYEAGTGFLEAIDWPHNGLNQTTTTVRILAVYLGAEGVPNATPAAGPQ